MTVWLAVMSDEINAHDYSNMQSDAQYFSSLLTAESKSEDYNDGGISKLFDC